MSTLRGQQEEETFDEHFFALLTYGLLYFHKYYCEGSNDCVTSIQLYIGSLGRLMRPL